MFGLSVNKAKYSYLLILIYTVCSNLDDNILVCSYLRSLFGSDHFSTSIMYMFYQFSIVMLFLMIKNFNPVTNKYTLNDYLLINFFISRLDLGLLFNNIIFIIELFYKKFLFKLFILKKHINIGFYINLFKKINLLWTPLFKKYSYLGYFRSSREVWNPNLLKNISKFKY